MKPLIFVILLFACVCAKPQRRFVQGAYVNCSQSCSVVSVTEQDCIMTIYSDSSVEFKMNFKYFGGVNNHYSYSHIFLGKAKINKDTISIVYTSSSSTQTSDRHSKLKGNYIPAPNERIFYPPTVFIVQGEIMKDLNSDFPVLNKVSPAVAMNIPQPK